MSRIFVSYRRNDSASETGRIVYHLARRFGKKAVFTDVFDIRGGQRFRDVISSQLARSKVLLAVIGPQWLTATNEEGRRRLLDPEDYVRLEIESALAQPACIVIPVLVGHQPLPQEDALPREIAELVERNAVRVRPDPDFQNDIEDLCQAIAKHVRPKKIWPAVLAVAGVMLSLLVAAFLLGSTPELPDTIVHAYDSSTGERILRPFVLTFEAAESSLAAVQHLLIDTNPENVSIAGVECPGFQSKIDRSQREVIKAGGHSLIKLFLTRATSSDDRLDDVDHMEAIKPNVERIMGWPTDPEILIETNDNTVEPDDVELIVHNKTDQHLDVLLFWLPPSTEPALANPFATRWTHINSGRAIEPGKRACFKSFRLQPGYFAFFASANGLEALRLYSSALYKERFVVATITDLTEHGLSLEFFRTSPPE